MEQSSALAPRNTHGHRLLKYISCLMWTSTLRQAPAHTNIPPLRCSHRGSKRRCKLCQDQTPTSYLCTPGSSLSPRHDIPNIPPGARQTGQRKRKPKRRLQRREAPSTDSPCKPLGSTTCSAPATRIPWGGIAPAVLDFSPNRLQDGGKEPGSEQDAPSPPLSQRIKSQIKTSEVLES